LNTFANILDFLPSGNIVELVKDKNELGSFDSLKINELSFSFDDSKPVIDQVDFSLNRQEFIGISGESGTGKTTLINILMGFYFVPDEAVKINNYPLQHVLQQWQSKIGLVKQDPFMLSGSIEDNITFGLEKEEERLKQVIEQTQLADWVKSLEDGLETNVGELGTMVSGGQRQRIALARCLYRDSEVLIFDEATNALDAENKSAILDLINDLNVNGKTVLMVSHDEEVLARCHRTLRLR
jgi:ABC-type bacteriocin/lantibiotic exporter with double-glycine peptidase domain